MHNLILNQSKMRIIFFLFVIINRLINLRGFVKVFGLSEINRLTQSAAETAGIFRLLSSVQLLIAKKIDKS